MKNESIALKIAMCPPVFKPNFNKQNILFITKIFQL